MQLTENKELFQIVFDSAANGIAVIESVYDDNDNVEDFSILLFNKYILRWIGDIDYKGKRYTEVFPMAKETGILAKLIEIAQTGGTTSFEKMFVVEGISYWFLLTAVKQEKFVVVTLEDITERKKAEVALSAALDHAEKQERLYNSITNNTPDLVYVFDLQYRFTYANKALLAMWGKSAENAIGRGLRENGYEEWHAQMHEREIDEIVVTKKPFRGTVSFPHAELGSRIYDYILVPVLNSKGEVEAVAGTTRDITDIKRVENHLKQSEARFRSLLQEAPVAATLFRGPELIIEIANDLTLQYWCKRSDIIGKPLREAAPELEEQRMITLLQNMYQRGGTASFSETPITFIKDGVLKEGYYSFSIKALYDNNGNVDSILSVGVDVTEQVKARKQIEASGARLKNMIDQTPAPTLVLMGDDLVIEQVNAPMLVLLGRGEEIIGTPLIKLMPELKGQYIWEQVEKVYREGIDFDQSEVLVPHKRTGVMQDYYYNIAYRPLKEDGRIIGMIQVAIDVTEQKTITEKLESLVAERTKELKRSNEDLQQFAHVASHDLKEPVRKIKTFTSRLEEQLKGKLDESTTRFIDKIQVATDRIYTMIDGVLAYSTINASKQQAELIDLNEILKNIENDLEIPLQKTGGTIQRRNLPVLEGAPVLLYQLFYNLVNNSIKFARAGVPPQIHISAETSIEGNSIVSRIRVQDNGIGFDPELAERIFETFTRLNSKDKYEGTGLGLSLCKKIVERHNGTIVAVGRKGTGATFIITLPVQQKSMGI